MPSSIVTLELSSCNELVSAQQQMYELTVSSISIRTDIDETGSSPGKAPIISGGCKSLSFRIAASENSSDPPIQFTNVITAQIQSSSNKLILRQWKRGACWWNCNTNNNRLISNITRGATFLSGETEQTEEDSTTLLMAKAEVEGYRVANLAFRDEDVYIAQVLYFSHDELHPAALNIASDKDGDIASNTTDDGFIEPWAILSYFEHGTCTPRNSVSTTSCINEIRLKDDLSFSMQLETPTTNTNDSPECTMCSYYPTTMIKTRHEFGFDEPHPRHGRVPADECLGYVKMILRDVVFPLQRYFFLTQRTDIDRFDLASLSCLHRVQCGDNASAMEPKAFQYLDMVSLCNHALDGLSSSSKYNENRTRVILEMLKQCVTTLQNEWIDLESIDSLPPVLCHMDLQPQNLAFRHEAISTQLNANHEADSCKVAAVMDWEEACYADPRFELILICRKVLTNREQAEMVWQLFSEQVQVWKQEIMRRNHGHEIGWNAGPLEPWLKLECVHSLCTLVIQLLDSVGGGRSPWETKTDLLEKINRERQRLVIMGWAFCDVK
ncbi:hypothetical protein ACHAWO_004960 [Cyclotella atomus]|uniref:Aminoglycoside phosphotransferase domain-containing protein n=1 Tax=Cyclotella atomus TaxID=382360 RepID=A0ABD3MYF3_9STRA